MSRPPEQQNGTHGAGEASGPPGVYGTPGVAADGDRQMPPNVYHPQQAQTPAYDEYADPAVAHGWQNAYDETAELPRFVNATGRRAHRRKRRGGDSRRVGALAGAVGAVSVAAVLGGWFALSGSSSDGTPQGGHSRTAPTTDDPANPTGSREGGSGVSASSGAADSAGTRAPETPDTSASPSATREEGTDSPSPTPSSSSATPSPAPTATTSTPADGDDDDKPGRGQGSTKGPK
ncbi:hypothetical protein [Streptomyces sp. NPDC093568]|uniref:hypothetical protein n=1 Tax=Streptomyces sp. NPDC093568 TaxID=3366041 RepID=UPI0037F68983